MVLWSEPNVENGVDIAAQVVSYNAALPEGALGADSRRTIVVINLEQLVARYNHQKQRLCRLLIRELKAWKREVRRLARLKERDARHLRRLRRLHRRLQQQEPDGTGGAAHRRRAARERALQLNFRRALRQLRLMSAAIEDMRALLGALMRSAEYHHHHHIPV